MGTVFLLQHTFEDRMVIRLLEDRHPRAGAVDRFIDR